MVYLPTFTIKNQPNVGKYTIHGSYGNTSLPTKNDSKTSRAPRFLNKEHRHPGSQRCPRNDFSQKKDAEQLIDLFDFL